MKRYFLLFFAVVIAMQSGCGGQSSKIEAPSQVVPAPDPKKEPPPKKGEFEPIP